ncbi:MAG TPA: hydrogenase expression protein HupD [Aquifex aeolicus]|nr:hydrogenase expression protein HupD [Aquifex aeolicus]
MKIEKQVLTRVEGEAVLHLEWDKGKIIDAKINIPNSRGIEKVLEGRPFMDALVINPRVCGICGHAHLIATAIALEKVLGIESISTKAKIVRSVTQLTEMVQNHIKWFYFFVMPDFVKINENLNEYKPFKGAQWKKAVSISSEIVKVIALFAGQWPHSSYAIPGGITSTFGEREVFRAKNYIKKTKDFFLKEVVGIDGEEFLKLRKKGNFEDLKGDFGRFVELVYENAMHNIGKAYNRFLSGGGLYLCLKPSYKKGKGRRCKFNVEEVKELNPPDYTKARPVRYKGLPYETGPLARQLLHKNPFVKELYSLYEDSYLTRVSARVLEIWEILSLIEKLLEKLMEHLDEKSCEGEINKQVSGKGVSFIEAARGTLIHKVVVEKGKIMKYEIITPSQWNLGPRCNKYLGVAEKAIIGLDSKLKAEMVLRSFDLCSVCTTH